jgi:hypothetical protein
MSFPELRRLRQEHGKFKTSLGHTVSSRPNLEQQHPVLKQQKQQQNADVTKSVL